MKLRQVTDAQIAEWRRIIAEHTPISASDPCPTCGPVCAPTWRVQRRWAKETLALHAPDTTMHTTHVEKGGEHLMRSKDYWSATPLTQPGGEPDEATPAVPDAEQRD